MLSYRVHPCQVTNPVNRRRKNLNQTQTFLICESYKNIAFVVEEAMILT